MSVRLISWLLAPLLLLPAPLAAQDGEPIVIGRSYSLPSAALGEQRTVNVWLPPGYAEGEARYPVIYLIDGGLGQDFQHIAGLAQLGALSWLTQEVIVVGVETVDRRRELAFPVERDAQLKKDYPTAGESALFRRYLVDEVKPFVDRAVPDFGRGCAARGIARRAVHHRDLAAPARGIRHLYRDGPEPVVG